VQTVQIIMLSANFELIDRKKPGLYSLDRRCRTVCYALFILV